METNVKRIPLVRSVVAACLAAGLAATMAACGGAAPPNYEVSHTARSKSITCVTKPADCYKPTQMKAFYGHLVGMVYDYWLGQWIKNSKELASYRFYFIPAGATIDVGCGKIDDGAVGYCDKYNIVYMGEKKLQSLYGDGKDDLLPALVLVQTIFDSYPFLVQDPLAQYDEVAAWLTDLPACMAGAFTRDAHEDRAAAAQEKADDAAIDRYFKTLTKDARGAFKSGRSGKKCMKAQLPSMD